MRPMGMARVHPTHGPSMAGPTAADVSSNVEHLEAEGRKGHVAIERTSSRKKACTTGLRPTTVFLKTV